MKKSYITKTEKASSFHLKLSLVWWRWHTTLISALRRQRQVGLSELEANLVYRASSRTARSHKTTSNSFSFFEMFNPRSSYFKNYRILFLQFKILRHFTPFFTQVIPGSFEFFFLIVLTSLLGHFQV